MLKQRFFIFLSLVLLGFLFYRNALGLFIPSDNLAELFEFEKQGLGTALFSHTFPRLASTPLMYLLYNWFGMNSYCWVSFSILLHAVNSFIVLLIASALTKPFFENKHLYIGIFAALLFLLSPYQTETVIWVPTCLPMLFATLWTLLAVYFLIRYLTENKTSDLFLLHITFLLAVLCYESGFFFPLAAAILYIGLRKLNLASIPVKNFIGAILFPSISLVFLHFLYCKIVFGHWFWRGGLPVEMNTGISFLAGNFMKYLAKFFLLYRYIGLAGADEWLNAHPQPKFLWVALSAICTMALFFFVRHILRKQNPDFSVLWILLACFTVSLAPVLTLDASFLKIIYSDRYGYLPSVFVSLFLAAGTYFVFKKYAAAVLLGVVLLFGSLLERTVPAWEETNAYCNSVVKNFEPYVNEERIYLLNLPSYYKGVPAFRSGFPEAVFFNYHKNTDEKNFSVVSQFFAAQENDSVTVVRRSEKELEVTACGNAKQFFYNYGGWANSYAEREFSVDYDPAKRAYLLSFPGGIPHDAAFLYLAGTKWKNFNLGLPR